MSLLRIRNYRNLWLGQAISQLGDSLYFVIFAFMVLRITGSPALAGLVSALEALPYLILSAYAGIVADRIDRRKIMLASDLASAAVLVVFACVVYLCHANPPVWTLMTTASTLSVTRLFFMPARGAAIPSLVPDEMLHRANAMSAATQNVMPLISMCLSAGVLAVLFTISQTWFFLSAVLINLASFFGSAFFVAKLPSMLPDRDKVHEIHPIQDFKDGVAFIRGRRELTLMLILQLTLNLMVSPFYIVYLVANKTWFHGLPQNLAWMEFSFFSGLVFSSVVVGKLTIRRPGLAYCLSMAGVGVSVGLMGLVPSFWLFVFWNVIAGLCIPFGSIPLSTYLQKTVPDAYRGRVNSAWVMASTGIQPIGMSLGGLLVQYVGLVGSYATIGGGMALSAMAGLFDRGFRRLETPESAPTGQIETVLLPPQVLSESIEPAAKNAS